MADVLDVAREKGCDYLVDLATLTGACVVALEPIVAGAMSNNPEWLEQVLDARWQVPASHFGHCRCSLNLTRISLAVSPTSRMTAMVAGVGAITAAKFLEAFVGNTPWVHLDIAGPAFYDKASRGPMPGRVECSSRTLVQLAGELKVDEINESQFLTMQSVFFKLVLSISYTFFEG